MTKIPSRMASFSCRFQRENRMKNEARNASPESVSGALLAPSFARRRSLAAVGLVPQQDR